MSFIPTINKDEIITKAAPTWLLPFWHMADAEVISPNLVYLKNRWNEIWTVQSSSGYNSTFHVGMALQSYVQYGVLRIDTETTSVDFSFAGTTTGYVEIIFPYKYVLTELAMCGRITGDTPTNWSFSLIIDKDDRENDVIDLDYREMPQQINANSINYLNVANHLPCWGFKIDVTGAIGANSGFRVINVKGFRSE